MGGALILHPGEAAIDAELAARVLAAGYPPWAGQPLRQLGGAGTDNVMLRVGDGAVLRLPRTAGAARALRREADWLPRLAALPWALPWVRAPLAAAGPAAGFPFPSLLLPWIEGADAWAAGFDGPSMARDLGRLVGALRALPFAGPGHGGGAGSNRGGPLAPEEPALRAALPLCGVAEAPVLRAWEAGLAAGTWEGPPAWFHGDLQPFNLLVREGRLAAVIDWGNLGTGDPACDLAAAWQVLDAPERAAFRDAVGADEASWARGRGWAILKAAVAIPYYRHTNPAFAAFARRTLSRAAAG